MNEKRNKLTIMSYHMILSNFYFIFNYKIIYFLLDNNIKQIVYNLKITIDDVFSIGTGFERAGFAGPVR